MFFHLSFQSLPSMYHFRLAGWHYKVSRRDQCATWYTLWKRRLKYAQILLFSVTESTMHQMIKYDVLSTRVLKLDPLVMQWYKVDRFTLLLLFFSPFHVGQCYLRLRSQRGEPPNMRNTSNISTRSSYRLTVPAYL